MTAMAKPSSAGNATGTATKTKKPSVHVHTNSMSGRVNAPSASPSGSIKKLPGSAVSATPVTNGAGTNANSNNSMARPNRRLQRISTRMSTSDNLILEKKATLPAEPFVLTEKYVLKKHKNKTPSLILHLYPNYFRFDQQEGSFSYHSEMRFFIEHLKKGTIPHDMLEELRIGNVRFYDGWLLVKIVDHKSVAVDQKTSNGVTDDEKPYSIHNYNHFITPSPCVPYPTKEQLAHSPPVKLERNGSAGDKENVAPEVKNEQTGSNPKSLKTEPKIFWKALQPTQLSRHMDLTLDYTAPDPKARKAQANPRQAGQPPTPSGTVPPTPITERPPPLKKQKLKIDPKDHIEYEARIVNATAPPLYLEAAQDIEDVERIYKMLSDPLCKEPPPSPKSRKRTVAELAADDAHAKEQERFMLIMDARSSAPGVTTNAAGVDPQAGTGAFQARFERFNALDNIKRDLEEKKKRDTEKRLQEDELRRSQQQQLQEDQARKQAQQQAIAQKREQAMLAAKQQQQMQHRQNQEAIAQAQAQAQVQAQQPATSQVQQGQQQPTPNAQQAQRRNTGQQPNGIPPQMQNQIMAQAASPIIRQGTPHAASSPAAPNARPMVRNGSQTGGAGSPPRPGSSLQHGHPNTANMIRQASGQGGQSRNGTPQIPHSTPGMNNATPIIRQGTPAHAMTQASPMVSMAMATPQMAQTNMQAQMPNGMHPGLSAQQQQQIAAMQRRQQMASQQAAMAQMNGGQVPNGAQMAQLAQHQAQVERAAAMRQQQQAQAAMGGTPQPQHMSPAPGNTAAQYQAQVRKQMMQQMSNQGGAGSPAPNAGGNQMSPQQMQAMQQMHQQQQLQQAMAAQNQQGQQGQQMAQQGQRQQGMNPIFQTIATQIYKGLFQRELTNPQYQGNPQMVPQPVIQQLKIRAQRQAAQQLNQRQQMGMQNNAQMMQQGGNPMMQQNSQQGNGMVPQNNMMMQQAQQGQPQGMQNMQNMQNMMGMPNMNMSQMQNANQHARQMQQQQMQIQNVQQQMMQSNYMQQMMNQMGQQGQQR